MPSDIILIISFSNSMIQHIYSHTLFYIDALRSTVSESTFRSHQTPLYLFVSWLCNNEYKQPVVNEEFVAKFTVDIFDAYKTKTLNSYLSALANFLAYYYQDDPKLVKLRILTCIHRIQPSIFDTILTEIEPVLTPNDADKSPSLGQVEKLISYLRHCQYASRIHVYVELLLDTRNRPNQVRNIDLRDLDLEKGTVTVGVSDMYVVGKTGLVSERLVVLSERSLDALESYIEYERIDPSSNNQYPLLTTDYGRVSSGTIRRSLRQASEAADEFHSQQSTGTESSGDQPLSKGEIQTVTPRDIWRYTVSNLVNNP